MRDYKNNYDDNPIMLLWIGKKALLPRYLTIPWLIIFIALFWSNKNNIIDLDITKISEYVDMSVAGLNFTLVIISAAIEVYTDEELKKLMKGKENDKVKNIRFINLITPYVFTSLIFLVLGILSIIVPLINFEEIIEIANLISIIYIMLLLLGLFSLFNISYTIINDLYHSIGRKIDDK